eukprot:9784899-Ditylum_brightwellii.AAC.1
MEEHSKHHQKLQQVEQPTSGREAKIPTSTWEQYRIEHCDRCGNKLSTGDKVRVLTKGVGVRKGNNGNVH